jgi:hypothetical protein
VVHACELAVSRVCPAEFEPVTGGLEVSTRGFLPLDRTGLPAPPNCPDLFTGLGKRDLRPRSGRRNRALTCDGSLCPNVSHVCPSSEAATSRCHRLAALLVLERWDRGHQRPCESKPALGEATPLSDGRRSPPGCHAEVVPPDIIERLRPPPRPTRHPHYEEDLTHGMGSTRAVG